MPTPTPTESVVPVVPVLLVTVLPFKTATWMYAVPLVGQQLVITRALRGEQNQIEPVGNLENAIFDGYARHGAEISAANRKRRI